MQITLALISIIFLFSPLFVFAKVSFDPAPSQWSYKDVKAYEGWEFSTGSKDVIVAVIDNGFDTFHPDLFDNVWKNEREIENNNIDDDANGYVDDVWGWNFVPEDINGDGIVSGTERQGNNNPRPPTKNLTEGDREEKVFHHGTVVAGIIGAVGNNGKSGAGLNWRVRLMNIKVVDNTGSGSLVLLEPAIRYAVDNGASIINISMVGNFLQSDVLEALQYAKSRGVALFAAAGNDSRLLDEEPRFPICADALESEQMIIGVSAIDETHHIARFSNFGSRCVDITAPGVNIESAQRYDVAAGLADAYGGPWSGTSFASPFVAGTAALIKAIQPAWQAPQVYETLLSTVHKTPPKDEAVYTHLFGKGLLQVDKALALAASGNLPAPVVPPVPSSTPPESTPVLPPASTPPKEKLDVLVLNEANGQGEIYQYSSQKFTAPQRTQNFVMLQGIESLFRYVTAEGETRYGVLYFRADGNSIVRLYNRQFERLGGFKKNLAFASTLVVADVVGDAEPEIILAPKVADTLLYAVYDKDGNEFFRVKAQDKHTGVSITKKFNKDRGKDDIAVLYKQGTRVFLEQYNGTGARIKQNELSAKTDLGGLFWGNVDGNSAEKFAMIVTAENTVWVRYYDENGIFLKRTPVFQLLGKEKRVNATFDDFDGDGQMELVVNEKNGGRGIYGVFGQGEAVRTLLIMPNVSEQNMFVVPVVTF